MDVLNNYYIRRALAFYIDLIIVTILALAYLFFFDTKGLSVECSNVFCWNTNRVLVFQFLFYFVYFVSFEFYFFNTIGKKIFGFKITIEKNKKLFWRIIIRTIIRLIPINFISFYFDNNNLFWHEKWTKIFTDMSFKDKKKTTRCAKSPDFE